MRHRWRGRAVVAVAVVHSSTIPPPPPALSRHNTVQAVSFSYSSFLSQRCCSIPLSPFLVLRATDRPRGGVLSNNSPFPLSGSGLTEGCFSF